MKIRNELFSNTTYIQFETVYEKDTYDSTSLLMFPRAVFIPYYLIGYWTNDKFTDINRHFEGSNM